MFRIREYARDTASTATREEKERGASRRRASSWIGDLKRELELYLQCAQGQESSSSLPNPAEPRLVLCAWNLFLDPNN